MFQLSNPIHHYDHNLPPLHLGRHGGVELGEALAQARLRRHGLCHAPADAARLAARERLGGEVVDAGGEAVVDEVAENLLCPLVVSFGFFSFFGF